jgi:hypothetical protein
VSWRRLLPVAALAALTTALAVVAGWPELGRSLDRVTGRDVSGATEFAFVGLLCWVMLAVTTVVGAVDALLAAHQSNRFVRRRRYLAVVAVGAALLVAGISRQQNEYRVCCASPSTAQQAEQLVP